MCYGVTKRRGFFRYVWRVSAKFSYPGTTRGFRLVSIEVFLDKSPNVSRTLLFHAFLLLNVS